MDNRVQEIMDTLNISKEEALDLMREDAAINRGERLEWEPTVEEEKQMRKNSKLSVERKRQKAQTKRERKVDVNKKTLIARLAEVCKEFDNCVIENDERTINFTYENKSYSINLIKHRTEKKEK